MGISEIIFICAGLSMDNMAAAAAAGCNGHTPAQAFKTAAVFAATGIICIILGWLGGSRLGHIIGGWGHFAASAILFFIGAKMLRESFLPAGQAPRAAISLPLLALATNIDVIAAGISLALYNVSLARVAVILAVFIAAATLLGFTIGRKLGAKFGRRAALAGGIILLILSIKIIIQAG